VECHLKFGRAFKKQRSSRLFPSPTPTNWLRASQVYGWTKLNRPIARAKRIASRFPAGASRKKFFASTVRTGQSAKHFLRARPFFLADERCGFANQLGKQFQNGKRAFICATENLRQPNSSLRGEDSSENCCKTCRSRIASNYFRLLLPLLDEERVGVRRPNFSSNPLTPALSPLWQGRTRKFAITRFAFAGFNFSGHGEDGHVASLFPGKTEGTNPKEICCAVKNSPKPPPNRISLSYTAIAAAIRFGFWLRAREKKMHCANRFLLQAKLH